MINQEIIAFGIVAFTGLTLGMAFFRRFLAGPLSKQLLNRGKVKWAMWIRKQALMSSKCSSCK